MSRIPDCGGDVAAYVLNALDPHEVNGFERHLRTCSVCQTEVESLGQAVDVLAMAAPQHPLAPGLRKRVMTEVRADAKRQRRLARADAPLRVPRYAPGAGYKAGLVSGVAMLALVLVLVVVAVTAGGSSRPHSAGAQVYEASTGSGEVIVRGDRGELIVHHLTPLSTSQTYEVWLERDGGQPQPTTTLFDVSANGDGDVSVPASLQGVSEMLVTREPASGSARPTTKPVVVARLS